MILQTENIFTPVLPVSSVMILGMLNLVSVPVCWSLSAKQYRLEKNNIIYLRRERPDACFLVNNENKHTNRNTPVRS